jgi:hypothetical protein
MPLAGISEINALNRNTVWPPPIFKIRPMHADDYVTPWGQEPGVGAVSPAPLLTVSVGSITRPLGVKMYVLSNPPLAVSLNGLVRLIEASGVLGLGTWAMGALA